MSYKKKKTKEVCGDLQCGKILLATEHLFECDDCKAKFHSACTDIKEEVYQILCAEKLHGGLFWRCRSCLSLPRATLVKKLNL